MIRVSVYEAKTNLSKYVKMLEIGEEDCVVITRHNKPVVKMIPYEFTAEERGLGIAEGKVLAVDGWDSDEINAEIAEMFGV